MAPAEVKGNLYREPVYSIATVPLEKVAGSATNPNMSMIKHHISGYGL